MAKREGPALAHLPKQPHAARVIRGRHAPARSARCPGAAVQLAAVHRALRHGLPVQLRAGGAAAGPQPAAGPQAAATNRTGLPDRLRSGVEALSGVSMDGVKVHYNSPKPAQLNALAYAQGTHIHLAPGQERHLPHETWHVVQQMQGRVRPTMQLREEVPVNDDAELEREADHMGARANEAPIQDHAAGGPDGARLSPALAGDRSASRRPVQRMVGFEIEMAETTVTRGPPPQEQPAEQEQYLGLDDLQVPLVSPAERASDLEEDEPAAGASSDIQKGATMRSGSGWRLTPDNAGGGWYGELITDPVDERTPNAIETILAAVTAFVRTLPNHRYVRMDDGYGIVGRGTPTGSFQVTGGIKIDQLVALLGRVAAEERAMADRADEDEDNIRLDPGDSDLMRAESGRLEDVAGRVTARNWNDPNYRGLVALLGSYLANRQEDAVGYAKQTVPVMSRTSLSAIREKVGRMPAANLFIADVLAAAGLPAGADGERLFPGGIANRSSAPGLIDATPNVTIRTWLTGIRRGTDRPWSEAQREGGGAFGFEEVGPAIPRKNILGCIPRSPKRAKGAIVELRNLSGRIPVDNWGAFGKKLANLFKNLNE